jgi:hypothetical protein
MPLLVTILRVHLGVKLCSSLNKTFMNTPKCQKVYT